MKRVLPQILLGLVALGLMFGATLRADTNVPTETTPAGLVQAALRSELDGPSENRKSLLDQALKLDPNFAPARWQSGFVKWDDEWRTFEQISRIVKGDEQLAEYRKRRDALVDTADSHRALARWCRKNKLIDEERIHWARALEFDANDAEALNGLGLQLYEGRLLSRKQIEQAKVQAGDRLRAMRTWQPKFVKWRGAIEHGTPKQLDEALRSLKELKDPEAIPALENVFVVNENSPKSTQLNLLLVETVSRMPQPEATQVLLRRALIADAEEVRVAATEALKKRPMHAYVPQLVAAIPSTLKTQFHIRLLPNGTVIHEHEVLLEGQKSDFSIVYETFIHPADANAVRTFTPQALTRELFKANFIEQNALATQQANDRIRNRVEFVLRRTTGFDHVDDPNLWTKQLNDHYELYTPSKAKPKYSQYVDEMYTYVTPPVDRVITGPSCFPAGTPVLTIFGSRPIEQIKMGDRVLSQDVSSGELVYKPVQATTLRPATPLVNLSMGGESILATPGHPFWVIGHGWRMAKQLKEGDLLSTTQGVLSIKEVSESRPAEAYNLVVGDLHNYFVGQANLLVHDNSPLDETTCIVPGLAVDQPQ